MPGLDEIRKVMEQNSKDWLTADATGKAKLAAANQALGKAIGASYDPKGEWDFSVAKDTPYTADQIQHRAWINDPRSGFGGMDNYEKMQNEKLSKAIATKDTDMLSRLQNDTKRVGYELKAPSQPQPQPQQVVSSTPSGYQSNYKGFDLTGALTKLRSLSDLNKASALTGIRNARDTAIQGYNAQQTQATQQAQSQRNAADAQTMKAALRLREVMAENGLLASGDNVQANTSVQNQGQQALASISQTEGNLLQDIGQKRALLQSQAASQEAALAQQIDADRLAKEVDLEKYGDERALAWDQTQYGRYRDTVDDRFREDQAELQKRLAEAGQTGYWNGERNMEGQRFDWSRDPRNPDNVGKDLSNEAARIQLEQLRDPNSPLNRKQQLDLQLRELELANLPEENRLKLEQLRRSINQIGAAPYRSPEQVELDRLKIEQAKAEIEAIKNPQSNPNRTDTNNAWMATVVSRVDQMSPDMRKMFFQSEKQNIVNQVGLSGYNQLYSQYFDSDGDPK